MGRKSAVVVFGSLNMDLSVACERIPRAGETVNGSGFVTNAGGKGANQAVAAARMGAHTYMVGAVGADAFGATLLAGLASDGIDCTHVAQRSDVATGTATILRCAGDNRIVLSPGANHALTPEEACAAIDAIVSELAEDAARDLAPAAGSVFIAQGECDMQTTAAALVHAHRLGFYTIMNPAPACELSPEAWAEVDLVCPNETECEALTGILPTDEASCQQALKALVAKGPGAALITLGAAGSATLDDAGEPLRMPSLSRDVADTTAAGDTFIGAVAATRVEGYPLFECMGEGARAAALTVGRVGAQQSIPTKAELDAWLYGEDN